MKELEPEDWFRLHEIEGARLWVPPPAAMETVVELFTEDRLTNPSYPHLFAIPRLMTYMWRKALTKDADLVFEVRAGGASFWPRNMHEPLVILLILPITFVPHYRGPWTLRGSVLSGQTKAALEAHFGGVAKDKSKGFHDLGTAVLECGKMKTEAVGIFCANSWRKRGIFPPCMAAWCQECYRQYPDDPFPVQRGEREEVDDLCFDSVVSAEHLGGF